MKCKYLFLNIFFLSLWVAANAYAQPASKAVGRYPERPVRVVVPVAAGGGTDIIARLTVNKLSEVVGQAFVVDNRPGAGGVLGNEIVARAPADGYTLLFTYAAHTIVPFIYRKVPYDVYKDFAPITMAGSQPLLLAVNASVKANTVQELIDIVNSDPRRGYGHEKVLTAIKVDGFTMDMLVKKGYCLEALQNSLH